MILLGRHKNQFTKQRNYLTPLGRSQRIERVYHPPRTRVPQRWLHPPWVDNALQAIINNIPIAYKVNSGTARTNDHSIVSTCHDMERPPSVVAEYSTTSSKNSHSQPTPGLKEGRLFWTMSDAKLWLKNPMRETTLFKVSYPSQSLLLIENTGNLPELDGLHERLFRCLTHHAIERPAICCCHRIMILQRTFW